MVQVFVAFVKPLVAVATRELVAGPSLNCDESTFKSCDVAPEITEPLRVQSILQEESLGVAKNVVEVTPR